MADGFAGGFAQGFASTRGGGGSNSRLLREQLDLQKEQFAFDKEQSFRDLLLNRDKLDVDRGNLDVARGGLSESRRASMALEETNRRLAANQEKQTELNFLQEFNKYALDTTLQKPVREMYFRQIAPTLGIDPKSPSYKETVKTVLDLDPDVTRDLAVALTAAGAKGTPGQIMATARTLMTGGMTVPDIVALGAEPELELKEIVDPNDPTRNIYAPENEAVYQQVPEKTPLIGPGETAWQKGIAEEEIGDLRKSRDEAAIARKNLKLYSGLRAAIESGRFTTGSLSTWRYSVGAFAELVGMDPETIPGLGSPATADAIDKFNRLLALNSAESISRLTNMSLSLVTGSYPGLSKTPGGNLLMAEFGEILANRAIEENKLAERYARDYEGLTPDPERFPGVPTFYEARDRMIADFSEQDEEFQEKIRTQAVKGNAIKWEDIPWLADNRDEDVLAAPELAVGDTATGPNNEKYTLEEFDANGVPVWVDENGNRVQ